MPITITVLPSNVDGSGSNFLYAIGTLAFSGSYITGGDTLDFTQVADKLPSTQIIQAFAESQNGNSGYYVPIAGTAMNNWKLKAFTGGGAEISAYTLYAGLRTLGVPCAFVALCPESQAHRACLETEDEYVVTYAQEGYDDFYHLADPLAGWRILLLLLRPGGVMLVGLYSVIARKAINAARAFVAERGYQPTADGIRACRQELIRRESLAKELDQINDFFTMSECRDMLFHVMEHQFTIARIKAFVAEQRLRTLLVRLHRTHPVKAAEMVIDGGTSIVICDG